MEELPRHQTGKLYKRHRARRLLGRSRRSCDCGTFMAAACPPLPSARGATEGRCIRNSSSALSAACGVIETDQRGCHGRNHDARFRCLMTRSSRRRRRRRSARSMEGGLRGEKPSATISRRSRRARRCGAKDSCACAFQIFRIFPEARAKSVFTKAGAMQLAHVLRSPFHRDVAGEREIGGLRYAVDAERWSRPCRVCRRSTRR